MEKDLLINKLSSAINLFTDTINQFPKNKQEIILFGEWSIKDMLAHFSGWNLLTIREFEILKKEGKLSKWIDGDDIDEINKKSVEDRKSKNFEDIYNEFQESNQLLIQKYIEMPTELWTAQFGPDREDNLFKTIQIDIDHFRKDHLPDIIKILHSFK